MEVYKTFWCHECGKSRRIVYKGPFGAPLDTIPKEIDCLECGAPGAMKSSRPSELAALIGEGDA